MAVWVATDLHGNYDLWEQIKNFLKEDDTLIFLGDAIDRGSRGFEIFKELLEHPQVVYLKGNHEDMMYNAFTYSNVKFYQHWTENGGQSTLDNIKNIGIVGQEKLDLIDKISKLPYVAEYHSEESGLDFILCHAGYAPGEFFDSLQEDAKINHYLWDRTHWNFRWPEDGKYQNTIMIHGHTPILYQKQINKDFSNFTGMAPGWYEGNHKVNLDAATAQTGMAFLLNLDTLDYEFFIADPDFKEEENKRGR